MLLPWMPSHNLSTQTHIGSQTSIHHTHTHRTTLSSPICYPPTTQPPNHTDRPSCIIHHHQRESSIQANRTQPHSTNNQPTMPLLSGISTGYQRLSKYISKAARKRLPLSPKRAGKGFYKGNKCASTGRVDSTGTSSVYERRKMHTCTSTHAHGEYIYSHSHTRSSIPRSHKHTGRFRLDEKKRIEINVPDLTGFKVNT